MKANHTEQHMSGVSGVMAVGSEIEPPRREGRQDKTYRAEAISAMTVSSRHLRLL
jgi:hypothetical protein